MLKQYHAKQILNIALAGHSSSGKTTVAEAMLFLSGGLERLGRVSEGTATLDFDPEEIKRKTSVTTAVAPVEWKNYKINLIDTPGLFDFEGSVCEAVRAADTMLIAVSAKAVLVLVRKRQWQQRIKMIWQKSFLSMAFVMKALTFTKYSKI